MKTIKIILIVLIMGTISQEIMASGRVTGLYLTADDYAAHKLSYASEGTGGDHITLNGFFESGNISVSNNGKKQIVAKSSIFGYRADGQDYRFFDNVAYKILDTRDFFIYCAPKLVNEGKVAKPVVSYYFSNTATSKINPLSIKNIENAFSGNAKFRYMVESSFTSDNALAGYDNALKEYEIKYLYDQAM